MKASPHCPPSCYAALQPALSESHTIVCRRRYPPLPQALATPHPSTSRAILSYGLGECASHVRTDRPHPAPPPEAADFCKSVPCGHGGAGLARKALRPPVASLPSKGFHTPAPVRGAFVLPATHDRGLALGAHQRSYRAPLEPIDQGTSSLEPCMAGVEEPCIGVIAPLDHSPETSASRHPRPELARSGRRAGGCHAPAP